MKNDIMTSKIEFLKERADEILKRIIAPEICMYLFLIEEVESGNIMQNKQFMDSFCSYFRINGGGKDNKWRKTYFDEMERIRKLEQKPKPNELLKEWLNKFDSVEFSFATKLIHILAPNNNYIYDSKIRNFLNINDNRSYAKNKLAKVTECERIYKELIDIYKSINNSPLKEILIKKFDDKFKPYFGEKLNSVSDCKKIDFYLWKANE